MPLAFVLVDRRLRAPRPPPSPSPSPTDHRSASDRVARAPPPSLAAARATSPTVAEIARLQALVAADPTDADAQRDLGFALLQRVRETADPSLYAPAEAAFEAARRLAPDDAQVLAGIGGLQLGKHQFADALETGRQAVAMSPNLAAARAVVVDALVELGRYDDADAAAAEMLAVRADLSTLVARLVPRGAARQARRRADRDATGCRDAGPRAGERRLRRCPARQPAGRTRATRRPPRDAYARALALVPAHAPSLAGEGRLAVGAGDLDEAIALFQRAADILPLPEYVIALADAQAAAGRTDEAARNVKLARAEIQLFQASGVIVDLDLALFEADHGDPAAALGFAKEGYAATPTVRAADALAWALHRLGRDTEARKRSDEALRLGSRDPLLRYHAGAIAAALGDAAAARRDLDLALADRPGLLRDGGRRGPPDPRLAARLSRPRTPEFIQRRLACASATTARMVVATRSAAPGTTRSLGEVRDPPHQQGEIDLSTRSRVAGVAGALLIAATSVTGVFASSHREAPLIAGDPAADNTDLYAFVSPDATEQPDHHRQLRPARGAGRWSELLPVRPGVRYEINVDNNGNGKADINYQFRFKTHRKAKNFAGIPTFLYNDGPITSLTDPNLLVWQTYDVWRNGHQIAWNVRVPPANIGPRSTADYVGSRRRGGAGSCRNGTKLFAGQRDDAFFVDLGSIFDLAGLRPFNTLHAASLPAEPGVDGVSGFNTNSIAIRVPLRQLTKDHRDVDQPERSRRRPRRVGLGQPAEEPCPQRERHDVGLRSVAAGLPPRQSADQRGDHPDRQEGLLEQPEAQQRLAVREVLQGARGDRRGECAL